MYYWSVRVLLKSLVTALVWGWGFTTPGLAAEQLQILIGPFEKSVAIADLERFVQTGELAPALKPYALVLTSDVRQVLGTRLQLDPDITRLVVDGLLQPPTGSSLLQILDVVVQNTTPQQIQLALDLAAKQAPGLNLIGVLKAYPEEIIRVDAISALIVALQLNLKYLESQALNTLLEQDLAVTGRAFAATLDPAAPGPEAVQLQTHFFRDQQRNRTIPVDLYWSVNSRGPLVVISHGFNSNRKHLAYLARHLASYGITVAALEHLGSSAAGLHAQVATTSSLLAEESSFFPAKTFVDRPQDVSFLLDELVKLNRQPGALQGKLNTAQVSIIGHSLGGYTALALAGGRLDLTGLRAACQTQNPLGLAPADWFQCYAAALPGEQLNLRDKRVAQIMAISPLVGNLFGDKGLAQVATPTLVVGGTHDAVAPALSNQLRPFAQLPSPKYLLTAIGETHLSIVNHNVSPSSELTFSQESQGKAADPLLQLLQGVSLAFIQQLTPQAKTYEPFLTATYVQSLSTASLPLRLNMALPASVAHLIK